MDQDDITKAREILGQVYHLVSPPDPHTFPALGVGYTQADLLAAEAAAYERAANIAQQAAFRKYSPEYIYDKILALITPEQKSALDEHAKEKGQPT